MTSRGSGQPTGRWKPSKAQLRLALAELASNMTASRRALESLGVVWPLDESQWTQQRAKDASLEELQRDPVAWTFYERGWRDHAQVPPNAPPVSQRSVAGPVRRTREAPQQRRGKGSVSARQQRQRPQKQSRAQWIQQTQSSYPYIRTASDIRVAADWGPTDDHHPSDNIVVSTWAITSPSRSMFFEVCSSDEQRDTAASCLEWGSPRGEADQFSPNLP